VAVTSSEFPIPTANNTANDITSGPDGKLWFIEKTASQIGRVATARRITEFGTTTNGSRPQCITAGPMDAVCH
jgi:virginiamycin B lyase